MKINSVHFRDTTLKSVNANSAGDSRKSTRTRRTDSVTLSGDNNASAVSSPGQATYEPAPRVDRVSNVRARMEDGAYTGNLAEDVARAVVDSPALKDAVVEVAMDRINEAGEQNQDIERIRSQVESGYYDRPEVQQEIAERLITAMGLNNQAEKLM